MFARMPTARKAIARVFALLSMAWLAACDPIALPQGGGAGPAVTPGAPVTVGLLVPSGSGVTSDSFLAQNLENAARLAISDLNGVQITLKVYSAGSEPAQAAAAATQAANDGAQIILGPLYAATAPAAGLAVASRGINVLAFTNDTAVAGGNVFILGATFNNTANRLARYAVRSGLSRFVVANSDDVPGTRGQQAITSAVSAAGGSVVGTQSYSLSQQGIFAAGPQIAALAKSSGAQAIFTTAGAGDELAVLGTSIRDNGAQLPMLGLTRWNAAPQSLATPALQGGLFALPDQQMVNNFESRYAAAYGTPPHPLAGLAYDGIAAIGALVASGKTNPLSASSLTQGQGFQGTSGIFRFLTNGTNERGLSIAQVQNGTVAIVDPAPRSFGGAGF